jgi:lipopolysaccharide export system permease protein
MLFDSSLRRELSRSFGGTLVVILTIVLTMTLLRTLSLAAGGAVSPQDVALLLGYFAIGYLPIILTLTLFIAVVSTITRLYRDSEMAIWATSGVSLRRFVPAVRGFAWPVMLVIAALVLVAWPWTNLKSQELRAQYEQRSDLSRVAPGQFQTSSSGDRVFFVDNDTQAQNSVVRGGGGIFILDQRQQRESVTTANAGRIEPSPEGRMLVLENGVRNDLDLRTGVRTVSAFQEYRVRIGEKALATLENLPPKARSSWVLWQDGAPASLGELSWRLGIILAAGNFILLGLGIASGDARRGGGWSLLTALLGFVVYFNLVNLTQAWIASGRYAMVPTLASLHGGVLVLALLLLWWRVSGHARRWLPRLNRRAAA